MFTVPVATPVTTPAELTVAIDELLLVHVPLQHRIFQLRDSSWEMASRPGYSEPFSASYIPDNLAHALRFFFGAATDQPNSLVLSALGVVALPFLGLLLDRKSTRLNSSHT